MKIQGLYHTYYECSGKRWGIGEALCRKILIFGGKLYSLLVQKHNCLIWRLACRDFFFKLWLWLALTLWTLYIKNHNHIKTLNPSFIMLHCDYMGNDRDDVFTIVNYWQHDDLAATDSIVNLLSAVVYPNYDLTVQSLYIHCT